MIKSVNSIFIAGIYFERNADLIIHNNNDDNKLFISINSVVVYTDKDWFILLNLLFPSEATIQI